MKKAPFIVWDIGSVGEEGRLQYFAEYKQRLISIEFKQAIAYRPLSDYDEQFKLKAGLET